MSAAAHTGNVLHGTRYPEVYIRVEMDIMTG